MRPAAQSGMSIIEIMVAVAIIGLLLAVGMPAYTTWIQNTQIRTAAEALLNGAQTARNEAIRGNVAMQLKLTGKGTTAWTVNPSTDGDRDPPMFKRVAEEGSPNATVTVTPGDADTVTFSALGRVMPNNDGSASIQQILVSNPRVADADRREMQIVIPLGGAIRMCDPKVTAADDPRRCL